MKVIFQASDGETYETQSECEKHERELAKKNAFNSLLFFAALTLLFFFL